MFQSALFLLYYSKIRLDLFRTLLNKHVPAIQPEV